MQSHLLLEALLFFYLYSIVSVILYLVALPILLLLTLKKKYRSSIPARFFLWKNPPLATDGIWFHSCSFGEARALAPLLERLPQEALRMTTTTQTGKSVIDTYTTQSRYLPFEALLLGWQKPQKALVVMEAEFWYLLFAIAKAKGAKTMLINARMSDRSFPKYKKMAWLYRRIFAKIDEVYAQTPLDKARLEALGACHVTVTGNIKLAQLPQPVKSLEKPDGLVVCAASTHEGEEEGMLEAFVALKAKRPDARLLVVPRHPERFESVASKIQKVAAQTGLIWQRYTQKHQMDADITLVDKLGMLVDLYAVSDVVMLGGSFVPVGGHNAAEAAQFGCKIISGPHYFNQRDIYEAVVGIDVVEPSQLTRRLCEYGMLRATYLQTKTDIMPIVKSLNDVLSD